MRLYANLFMFLSVALAGQMSCILIDVSVYLRFLGNRSLYLSAYQAFHRRRQSCNLSFSLPSFCLMVLSLSISDTSTCCSPSFVFVKIHPNIFSVTKKGGSVSLYTYTLKAYIFLTLVGPAIIPDISSCVPALWKRPAYNQWHAVPRYNFVQHGSAGRGGIYCSKSFAAVERLALFLRETHESVLVLVFYAALREMLQVSLQDLDVRILTCRQAKGCECDAAILFIQPRQEDEHMATGALTEVGKLTVGLSRAKMEPHILFAIPWVGGTTEWTRLYEGIRPHMVP